MNLRILLLLHALVTLAAGIVLIIAPSLIPGTIDVHLNSDAYLLSYFLGAAELSIAYLSFFSRRSNDTQVLRLVTSTFIVFHSATGIVELYAFVEGVSSKILLNVSLRIVIIILFGYYGYNKPSKQKF